MGLPKADVDHVRAIRRELDTVRLDPGGPALATLMQPIHEVLGGDFFWAFRPVQRPTGWELDNLHAHALPASYAQRFRNSLAGIKGDYAWFDPTRPAKAQRNRVVEALGAVHKQRPGYFETTQLYREFFVPLRLEKSFQLRVLVCDGPSLLTWIGTYQQERPTARQHRVLSALVPHLQRRLLLERQLVEAPRNELALIAALERLGMPAFVLARNGDVYTANAAGLRKLEAESRDVRVALVAAIHGRPTEIRIELTPLRHRGLADGWLATFPSSSPAEHTSHRVQLAARRWSLTKRQSQVLELVARGLANATIADALEVTERAVELHVTAIFDKAGVDSRSAVVARVFID